MNDTKLTILIGTYNRLSILKKCLDSIEVSKKYNYQVFVIDAGSTDGTIEYVRGLKNNIHLIKDNCLIGQAASFNKVLPLVKSKYVCWLSDDDMLNKNMLSQAIDMLEKQQDIGMVALKVKDVFGSFIDEPYIGGIWPSGVLNANQGILRLEILHFMDFFDKKFPSYGIDANLTTQVLLCGYKVVYTREVSIFHYRDHYHFPGAFENENRKKLLKKALKIYKRKYKYLCLQHKIRKKSFTYNMYTLIYKIIVSIYNFSGIFIKIGLERGIGFYLRDWKNSYEGQFISPLDLVYNRRKPYYLVQEINLKKYKVSN